LLAGMSPAIGSLRLFPTITHPRLLALITALGVAFGPKLYADFPAPRTTGPAE
jgi:hypothetical protein